MNTCTTVLTSSLPLLGVCVGSVLTYFLSRHSQKVDWFRGVKKEVLFDLAQEMKTLWNDLDEIAKGVKELQREGNDRLLRSQGPYGDTLQRLDHLSIRARITCSPKFHTVLKETIEQLQRHQGESPTELSDKAPCLKATVNDLWEHMRKELG